MSMHILDRLTWPAFQKRTKRTALEQALVHTDADDFSSEAVATYKIKQADLFTTVSGWKYQMVRFKSSLLLWNIFALLVVAFFFLSFSATVFSVFGCAVNIAMLPVFAGSFTVFVLDYLLMIKLGNLEQELADEQIARWRVVPWKNFNEPVPDEIQLLVKSVQFHLPKARIYVHVLKTYKVVDPILEIRHAGQVKFPAIWDDRGRRIREI